LRKLQGHGGRKEVCDGGVKDEMKKLEMKRVEKRGEKDR
jgi:hypothetical protein